MRFEFKKIRHGNSEEKKNDLFQRTPPYFTLKMRSNNIQNKFDVII